MNRGELAGSGRVSGSPAALLFARQRQARERAPGLDYRERRDALAALEALLREHADELAAAIDRDFEGRSRDETRLLEIFDNHDGTLSIFGTIVDHVGQAAAPAPGTAASAMDLNDLASAGRTMSFNDLQSGAPIGEGVAKDRNVELLIDDPR